MNIKIEPRKETDRGGYLCLPLCRNVPEGATGWIKIHCPACGEMCWWRTGNIGLMYHNHLNGAVCTECALKMKGG